MNEHEYADADSEYTNPHESTMAGLFGLPGNVDDKKVSEWFPWFDKRLAFSNLDDLERIYTLPCFFLGIYNMVNIFIEIVFSVCLFLYI